MILNNPCSGTGHHVAKSSACERMISESQTAIVKCNVENVVDTSLAHEETEDIKSEFRDPKQFLLRSRIPRC